MSACDTTATVNFRTGELLVEVSASSLELPDALRDPGPPATLRSIPCSAMRACPRLDPLTLRCSQNACDPEPVSVSLPLGYPINFDLLETGSSGEVLNDILPHVDRIEIRSVTYSISEDSLNVELGELELYWGPEGAADIDPAEGVVRMATLDSEAARDAGTGAVPLDAAGNAALSAYLLGTARTVRFFVRTPVDIEPLGPFPAGNLSFSVRMAVTAEGRIVE